MGYVRSRLHKQQAKNAPGVSLPYNEEAGQLDALKLLSGMTGDVDPGMQSALGGMMGLLTPSGPEAGAEPNLKIEKIGNKAYVVDMNTGNIVKEWEGPEGAGGSEAAPNRTLEVLDRAADLQKRADAGDQGAAKELDLLIRLRNMSGTSVEQLPGGGVMQYDPRGPMMGSGGSGIMPPQPGTQNLPEMQAGQQGMQPQPPQQPPMLPGLDKVTPSAVMLRTHEQTAREQADAARIKKQADAALDIPALELDVNAAIGRVDDLLKNESLPSGVGVWDQYLAGGKSLLPFNQGTAGFLRDHEAVMSDKILQELTSIKASGATLGQITEKELEVLKTAKENLSRGQSEADFRENARKLKDAYRDIMTKLKLKAGQNPAATGSAPEVISIDEAIRRRQSGGST